MSCDSIPWIRIKRLALLCLSATLLRQPAVLGSISVNPDGARRDDGVRPTPTAPLVDQDRELSSMNNPQRRVDVTDGRADADPTSGPADRAADAEELPPCNDVLLHETAEERCRHAKNCEGEYMMTRLLPLAFCKGKYSYTSGDTSSTRRSLTIITKIFLFFFPVLIATLTLLLFRLLGSTAENYFSPALEMISSEFRVPPALAGVTLLALGNGAPDVSAVVNAIRMSASEGIPLSLGELTGGGMFVQSIVVGRILFLGSNVAVGRNDLTGGKATGVACRGELIRDIAMYGISAAYVFWMCSRGAIFYRHVAGMLALYCAYVTGVFLFEMSRYCSNRSAPSADVEGGNEPVHGGGENKLLLAPETETTFDEEDQTVELARRRPGISPGGGLSEPPKPTDPPGTRPAQRASDPQRMKQSSRVLRMVQRQRERRLQTPMEKRKSPVVDVERLPQDRAQSPQPDRRRPIRPFNDSLRDLWEHFRRAIYVDIWSNAELSRFEWFCTTLESPLIIIRKLVTPIPCESEYNRSMVAYSIGFSPVWIFFYLSTKMEDFDPFCAVGGAGEGPGRCFPSVVWPCCFSVAVGCAVIKYAPSEDNASLPLHVLLPISLYGFLVAATWIDVISDQLVNVLEFIGVVLRIPAPIMGMTVLAWGNSVGDFTTNGILAQRGLADMSMAACFAGPSFNLLVGLGCGLLTQRESLMSNDGLPISLMPSVKTGFIFLIFNCAVTIFSGLWNRGIIPRMHGYIFWAMYFAYMTLNAQQLSMWHHE